MLFSCGGHINYANLRKHDFPSKAVNGSPAKKMIFFDKFFPRVGSYQLIELVALSWFPSSSFRGDIMSNWYWLTMVQMARLWLYFPKGRGKSGVDDRCVLSGIIFANRNGLRWCDAPKEYCHFITAGSGGVTWGYWRELWKISQPKP